MNTAQHYRLHYLDSLRGIAALTVCIQHIFGYLYRESNFQPLLPYFKFLVADVVDWGRFGVVLFFLISGFIIPQSLKTNSSLQRFLTSRFFRLYPAYWLALLLIYVSAWYLTPEASYSTNQFLANLTMIPKLLHQNYMSGVFWTLFIEILFYVCCVFLFKLRWLNNTLMIGAAAITFNVITPLSIAINHLLHTSIPVQYVLFHLSFLFMGNLLRLAFVEKDKRAMWFCACFIALNCFSIPIASGMVVPVIEATKTGFVMFNYSSNILAYGLASALFVFAIYFKNLSSQFLMGTGEISYSLYLLHMLCFLLVAKFIHLNSATNILIFLCLSAALSYLVAKLSYMFVEYPTIQLSKKIVKLRGYA